MSWPVLLTVAALAWRRCCADGNCLDSSWNARASKVDNDLADYTSVLQVSHSLNHRARGRRAPTGAFPQASKAAVSQTTGTGSVTSAVVNLGPAEASSGIEEILRIVGTTGDAVLPRFWKNLQVARSTSPWILGLLMISACSTLCLLCVFLTMMRRRPSSARSNICIALCKSLKMRYLRPRVTSHGASKLRRLPEFHPAREHSAAGAQQQSFPRLAVAINSSQPQQCLLLAAERHAQASTACEG